MIKSYRFWTNAGAVVVLKPETEVQHERVIDMGKMWILNRLYNCGPEYISIQGSEYCQFANGYQQTAVGYCELCRANAWPTALHDQRQDLLWSAINLDLSLIISVGLYGFLAVSFSGSKVSSSRIDGTIIVTERFFRAGIFTASRHATLRGLDPAWKLD